MGTANDGAYGADNKIPVDKYIKGTKLLGAYLHEFARAT
jgi:hypothetical protein